MKNRKKIIYLFSITFFLTLISCKTSKPIQALIVSGQNNHNWHVSHQVIKQILDHSKIFSTDIALTVSNGENMNSFCPTFNNYDVIILDYNGDRWPAKTDSAFLQYIRNGGGLIIYHAADNAFADWKEYNQIIALGGWEGRNEESGPYCYLENGKLTLDHSAGPGGSHGQQREFTMHCYNNQHPITKGLPPNWLHAKDEMYDQMRGPANIKDLLYSGKTDPKTGGSGREEPLVFTVDYGKARIVHIMLGHCGPTFEDNPSMQCIGFQTLLLRSAEWAATGKVSQPVPSDFPTEQRISLKKNYGNSYPN